MMLILWVHLKVLYKPSGGCGIDIDLNFFQFNLNQLRFQAMKLYERFLEIFLHINVSYDWLFVHSLIRMDGSKYFEQNLSNRILLSIEGAIGFSSSCDYK